MIITRNKLFHLSYIERDPGYNKKMIASQTWGQNDRLIVDTNSFFAKSRTLHLLGMATCHWQELNWCGLLATALSPRVSLLSKNTRGVIHALWKTPSKLNRCPKMYFIGVSHYFDANFEKFLLRYFLHVLFPTLFPTIILMAI